MDNLVGIPAEHEMARLLQGFQHERELHGGDVLHLVNNHEVVARRSQRLPVLGDKIQVVELCLVQPGAILLKQIVELVATFYGKDRLTHSQCLVLVTRHDTARPGSNHAANLLESLVGFDILEVLPYTGVPARKVTPASLASCRNADRLDKLPVGQKYGILTAMLKTVGVIKVAGALRQEGGVSDVEDLTFGKLELFKRQCGLAAASAADDNQGRWLSVNGLLRVIKRDRFVEQVNAGTLGMKVA